MDHFKDKVAIVTGGASGIGRALCEALAQRGAAMVIVADINEEGAQQAASGINSAGGQAQAARLDVSNAEDVEHFVNQTASQHGRLDFMFNNAGVGLSGELRDMTLDHWRRVLDVNLWGVVYGTTAAYRVMVKQGFGHIVNVSSAAGLVPFPMGTAYSAGKHAVVGLSLSLRGEAADLGVKVSVVCPGLIQTGIYDTTTYLSMTRETALAQLSSLGLMKPSDCARHILRGVERNRAIVPVTALTRVLWWLNRISPSLLNPFIRRTVRVSRAKRIGA